MMAKFKEKYYDLQNNPVLVYKYRGSEYEVIDYGWKGGEPLSWQHKMEQAKIDESYIEKPAMGKSEPAQMGLDKFFDYLDNGVWEDR